MAPCDLLNQQIKIMRTLLVILLGYIHLSIVAAENIGTYPFTSPDTPNEVKHNLLIGNFVAAAKQLERLTSQGDLTAKYQLSLLYLRGRGVKKSVQRAESLLLDASRRVPEAAYLLGVLYHKGTELTKDTKKARYYLLIAASRDNVKAKQLLKKLKDERAQSNRRKSVSQVEVKAAITEVDIGKLEKLKSQGKSFAEAFENGDSPLIYALKTDALTANKNVIINWLVNENISLDYKNVQGNTALHTATKAKRLDQMKILTSRHSDLNLLNNKNQSAIMIAINSSFIEGINWLIKRGAIIPKAYKESLIVKKQVSYQLNQLYALNKNQTSQYYKWPLVAIATAQGQAEVAIKLIKEGHSPWELTPNNSFAINLSLINNNIKLTQQMLELYPVKHQHNKMLISTFFLSSVASNQIDFIYLTLPIIKDLNVPELIEKGLMIAAKNNNAAALKILLRQLQTQPEQELLVTAISQNNVEVTKVLLDAGATLTRENDWLSLLVKAIQLSNLEMMGLLIKTYPADINDLDDQGTSALMWAAKSNCYNCAALLLLNNADPLLLSKTGNSALMYAAQISNELLVLLLSKPHDIQTRNQLSFTALMLAVKSDCVLCVSTLLENNANPRRKSQLGQDSFDLAANKPKILKLLNES